MLLVVDLATLLEVDTSLDLEKLASLPGPQATSPAPDYWRTSRVQPDGSELVALDSVEIRGRIADPNP
jgi:hypothetical protein